MVEVDQVKYLLGRSGVDAGSHVVGLIMSVHFILEGAFGHKLADASSIVGAEEYIEVEGCGLDDMGLGDIDHVDSSVRG